MSKQTERIQELMTFEGHILEMVSSDNGVINVPVDPRIDVSALISDDDDPKFVNVEVIRTGISKTNRRRYGGAVVSEINTLTPGVQGFLGHPDPSKYGFEFREPQCIFVGSMVQEMQGGSRTIAKAYLFKTSPLREWVPKSIASGNPMTVSINAIGDVVKSADVLDVIHISELQSIDWANPGTEGMGTSKAMSVVKEMQDQGGNEMEPKEIIKGATVAELRAFNPDAVGAIVKGLTLAELQSSNQDLYNQIVEASKVTEMQVVVGGEKKTVQISELQGVIDGLGTKITELQTAMDTMKLESFKATKLAELVPENIREMVSKRVTGKNESEIEASITGEIAYIREMGGIKTVPGGQGRKSEDEVTKGVMNLFGVKDQFVRK